MKTAEKERNGGQTPKKHEEKSKNYMENVMVGKHTFKVQIPQRISMREAEENAPKYSWAIDVIYLELKQQPCTTGT